MLLRVGIVVFVVQSIIMLSFMQMESSDQRWQDAFHDASILTVIVAIVVHQWIIQPLDARLALTMTELSKAKLAAERLAQTDPLTGVLNRRAFFDHFEREWSKSERTNAPLSCLMLDIDYFKRVNDTHGHLVGDVVLREIVKVMQSSCRAYDDIGRYGGEEFCILLPETPLAGAIEFADRLRTLIGETVIYHCGRELTVTVSIGAAQRSPQTANLSGLIESADHALLDAKRLGRNRVWAVCRPLENIDQSAQSALAVA